MSTKHAQKRGFLDFYFKTSLLRRVFIGFILGAAVGISAMEFGWDISWMTPFGDLFVRLLKMIVMPIILFTLIAGASSIKPKDLLSTGGLMLVLYMGTTIVAILIGLVMADLTSVGSGMVLTGTDAAKSVTATSPPLSKIFLDVVPTNPFEAVTQGQALAVIFVALVMGIALSILQETEGSLGKHAALLCDLVNALGEVWIKIVGWVMQYAPIGVFALIAHVFAVNGPSVISSLISYMLIVIGSHGIIVFVMYVLMLKISGLRVRFFFYSIRKAVLTAFATRSSSATLPVSMEAAESMGISRNIYSFSLPLGATVNMDGTAVYIGIASIFVANAIGVPLSFTQEAIIFMTALITSIGTAGVPGAGTIMVLLTLSSIGINIAAGTAAAAAYAITLGVDAILDMFRTVVNITGDLTSTAIIAKRKEEINLELWQKNNS